MEHTNITYLGDAKGENEITADSKPVFNIPFWPFDNDTAWNCGDWILWHQKLTDKYGLQEANARFVRGAEQVGVFDSNYSFCKYNDQFREYFAGIGVDVDNFASSLYNSSGEIVKNVSEGSADLSKGAANIASGLGNLNVSKILGIAGVVGAGFLLYPYLPQIINKIGD